LEKDQYNIQDTLIKKCRKNDSRAQLEIYRMYFKSMYNTSLRIVKNEQEAEDIMQEAFLSAFENIATYNGSASFGSWLKRIVINKSLDSVKKMTLELVHTDDDFHYLPEPDEQEDNWITIERAAAVKSAIFSLADGYRIILSLYLLEGYDHEEIAEILNISASTSRSQYARAKKRLSEMMKISV
jgi:RNA polymerase sigma factor (sigma-70 family)